MGKVNEKIMPLSIRAEYIEVEPNVRLHITDAGEERPIILIHGWPLSDEMYEYQYNDLITNNFCKSSGSKICKGKLKEYKSS